MFSYTGVKRSNWSLSRRFYNYLFRYIPLFYNDNKMKLDFILGYLPFILGYVIFVKNYFGIFEKIIQEYGIFGVIY